MCTKRWEGNDDDDTVPNLDRYHAIVNATAVRANQSYCTAVSPNPVARRAASISVVNATGQSIKYSNRRKYRNCGRAGYLRTFCCHQFWCGPFVAARVSKFLLLSHRTLAKHWA